jgi:transcriptional regulator with XRE-family HTH domain
MDFKDFASRMKQAKKANDAPDEPTEYDFNESYRIRGKMLGVLIRDARMNAARTIDDCARLLNVQPELIEAWEYGDAVPDLPQLELLAYYLDVPVSHFWSLNTMDKGRENTPSGQVQYVQLRQRMIGALLKQAREDAELSLDDIAESSNIPVEILQQYEMGEIGIPMHEMSMLSHLVKRNMSYFLESSSYIGELLKLREDVQAFSELDDDVREFAANPLNVAFIRIAMTFSKMPASELRKAAEGLLEIAM